MSKKIFFKIIFSAWLILWVFFLIREDKDGQYGFLAYNYTHGYEDKIRSLHGDGLHKLLVLASKEIPEGATYEITGFEKFSIDEVRARYYLWPLKNVGSGADYRIVFGSGGIPGGNYETIAACGDNGVLLKRKGAGT